jgi:hypothetical protein
LRFSDRLVISLPESANLNTPDTTVCGTGSGCSQRQLFCSAPLLLALLLGGVCVPCCLQVVSFARWAAAAGRSSTAVYVCCPGPVAADYRDTELTPFRPVQVHTDGRRGGVKVEYHVGGHGP